VELPGRPAIHYDALTIDVGITPAARAVPGAIQFATPVKPISTCAMHTPVTLSGRSTDNVDALAM